MRWFVVLAFACGCSVPGGRGGGGDDDDVMIDAPGNGSGSVSVFDPSITNVVVEIDYETGNEPYTGPIVGFGDTFEPTQFNIDRLFAGKK
ncbi:MAG TPA: hypothetical protein VFV99_30900, partial [Kofleriaceae bacterium]|nr:hypothetical protein [Kofleriaceae bacterium]